MLRCAIVRQLFTINPIMIWTSVGFLAAVLAILAVPGTTEPRADEVRHGLEVHALVLLQKVLDAPLLEVLLVEESRVLRVLAVPEEVALVQLGGLPLGAEVHADA
eukprot:8256932-Pyramimonas_sp.AAC.1